LHRLLAPTASDAALLARWIGQRDEAAFADLVARHGPMVLGVCRRVLGDAQHAEDAFQATFLVLARKAADLRRPESLPGFLYGVALRLARKARQVARRQPVQAPPDAPEPVDPHVHPLDELSGRELLTLLDDEVARLPEVYRLPVLLCVIQGRPVEEAAQRLGWSIGSVRGRLARGRARLRERLSRRGLGMSAGALALLTPAAVSEYLLAETLRNLASPAPAAVSALAGSAAFGAGLPTPPLKAVGLVLLLMAAGLGAGLAVLRAPEPEAPTVAARAEAPAQAKDEPGRDRYGDPLPPPAIARLGTLRFRAPGELAALAFAPDGKTVAASSNAGLFFFDAASGKRVQGLASVDPAWGAEKLLVFSPDGKRLAGRGQVTVDNRSKGVVRVWELAGERKPRDYDAEHAVWVGWSAGGEPLAVCLEQGALRLRELDSGRSRRFECKDLPRPELYTYALCTCTASGQTLAVADEGRHVVHVWDTATGRERCTLRPKNACVRFLALSPDGRTLASLNRDLPDQTREAVQFWDATTGEVRHTVLDQMDLSTVAFAPDGKTLATAGWRELRFWDVATGRERSRSQSEGSNTENIAFSSDGQTLATAERHAGAIHLWNVATGERKPAPVGHRCRPHGTAFSPDGRRLATGGELDGTIHIWDLATSESLLHIPRAQWVRDVAFAPDGRSLFSTWTDENLWVSDAATGERQHVIKLEDPDRPDTYQSALAMHLSADGKTLVAFSSYYPKKNQGGPHYRETLITGWDTSTRKQLFRRRCIGMDSWPVLSADARVLAAAHSGGSLEDKEAPGKGPMRLEDVTTGERLLTFPTLEGQTSPLAFSPDQRLLASSNFNWKHKDKPGDPAGATGCALHLWETATAAEVLTLPLQSQYRTAFSPDGRLLALTAPAEEILVWDLARGRELRRFKGFDAEVTWLAFSPDGRRLISGLADSTLLVWDVGPRPAAPAGKLGVEGLAKAWADLAAHDAPRAFRARWALAAVPEETLPLLKQRLHPAQAADMQRLSQLLADLDSDRFAVREKAQADLEELGDLAAPALRQTLTGKPTLEVRRRVQAVLGRLRGPVRQPELRRSLRALPVLEDIGTPAARKLLDELASGAPEARLTREAKASVSRLERKTPASRTYR
jgi:RNA polymerase sigma factor (sigma-70 family)